MLTAEYIAGFFDGEGCVSGSYRGYAANLAVSITQRKPEILYEIDKQFPTLQGVFPKPGLRRMCYRIHWSQGTAKPLLEAILPYIFVKKSQVELALKFIELSPGTGGESSMDDKLKKKFIIYDIQNYNDGIKRYAYQNKGA